LATVPSVRQIFQQIKDGGAARYFERRAQRACALLQVRIIFQCDEFFARLGPVSVTGVQHCGRGHVITEAGQ